MASRWFARFLLGWCLLASGAALGAFRGEGGDWVSQQRGLEVRVRADGSLCLGPGASPAAAFSIRTAAVLRGTRALDPGSAPAQLLDDGAAERGATSFVERIENREAGVEQSWRFPARPPGRGDLRVRLRVEGPRYQGATAGGHDFVDPGSGARFHYGAATFIDQAGATLALATRRVGGGLEITVPAAALDTARYPARIDPLVSAELVLPGAPVLGRSSLSQYEPSVAFDGTNYLAVWTDNRGDLGSDIVGARFSGAGALLDATGFSIAAALQAQEWPRVVFDGANFFVVWGDRRNGSDSDIYGARVRSDATVLDPNGIAISTAAGDQRAPAVAVGSAGLFVAWQDARSAPQRVYGTRVTTAGVVLDPSGVPLSSSSVEQSAPAVGSGGTDFFAAWADDRNGPLNLDVYGTRISGAGAVLDPAGLAIAVATGTQAYPAVGFGGGTYLVAWQDDRAGDFDVYAARVTPTGTVVNPGGSLVGADAGTQMTPTVAFDGTDFAVAWADGRSAFPFGSAVYAARVSTAGAVQDPGGDLIHDSSGSFLHPQLTFGGSRLAVVWDAYDLVSADVFGVRFLPGGTVLDTTPITLSQTANNQDHPSVAFDGASYLAVWSDSRADGTEGIYGARFDRGGVPMDPDGFPIAVGATRRAAPRVAGGATGFFVVWKDYRTGPADIYGARVTASGVVLDPGGFAVNTSADYQITPAVVAVDGGYFVVWEDYRSGTNGDVYGTRVTADAGVLDPAGIPVAAKPTLEFMPALAYDGTHTLAVWVDDRDGGSDIYAARIAPDGTVLDDGGVPVSLAAGGQGTPAAAFDGLQYLVTWEDQRNGPMQTDLFATRMTSATVVLDPAGIPVSLAGNGQSEPAVVFDGVDFLVVWQDSRSSGDSDVYAARLSRAGALLDLSGVPVAAGSSTSRLPSVAAAGGGVALAFYSRFDPSPGVSAYRLRGRFIGALATGASCIGPTECASGECVAAVCCSTACPGGSCVTGQCVLPVDAGTPPVDGGSPPRLVPQPALQASCGEPWRHPEPGAPLVEGEGPFEFALEPEDGGALPAGLSLETSSGTLSWTPVRPQQGTHRFGLRVTTPSGTDRQDLEVSVECTQAPPFGVGCGCGAGAGAGATSWILICAGLAALRRRRSHAAGITR